MSDALNNILNLLDESEEIEQAKQQEEYDNLKDTEVQFTSVHGRKSTKLNLDKYYTPREHADHVVKVTFERLGHDNITEVLETSAGAGVFLDAVNDYLKEHNLTIPVYGYDLYPEREDVVQQDYLKLDLAYKPGRLIIGNPPFGKNMQLAKKFFKKGVGEADTIAWILPAGQYQNNTLLYEFDLEYSELLGEVEYSGTKKVNSCFNIYERDPDLKGVNKRPNETQKLMDLTIYSEQHRGYREMEDYDVRMVYWGSAGKILGPDDKDYAGEFKIKVHKASLRDQVIEALNTVNWEDEVTFSAMPRLKQRDVIKYLKKVIPTLQ